MPIFHCPLCPLIFECRGDVEQHVNTEHRSRADADAGWRAELAAATGPFDAERLVQLRSSEAVPSVTLLLSTAPAAVMTVLDIARLRQLAGGARRRLLAEPRADTAVPVGEDRLARVVSVAESQATDRGMAVMVNGDDMAVVKLPFAPRDRHVVDRGFATRDLDYALRRFPLHRVLVLGHHARVLEGHPRQLSEPELAAAGRSGSHPSADTAGCPDPDVLIGERVDTAGRLPLVVVGDRSDLVRFLGRSSLARDVIAVARRSRFRRTSVPDLAAEALDRSYHERQSRAVAELLHADLQSRIAWGVRAAWSAIQKGAADRLWVEHDFALAGRRTPGACGIETISDRAEPGAVDDLVDVLLTRAAQLGVETHLLDRHAIGAIEPVAVEIPVPAATRTLSPLSMATR